MAPKSIPHSERFWSKVNKTDSCWLWTAGRTIDGYGSIQESHTRRRLRAHRVAYELAYGPIPDGQQVCHHCDTPLCVRPDHLFLGTFIENMQDKIAKGRTPRGEAAGNALLTETQVREIRDRYVPRKVSTRMLAREFGVSQKAISGIVLRRTWQHLE